MSTPSAPADMAVKFVGAEKAQQERTASIIDLQKFNSAAPTLNNTPDISRSPSPNPRRKLSRTPTPAPTQGHIEDMDIGLRSQGVSKYSNNELDISYMNSILILCFFCSGLTDAVAFNSWNCFVGMQTGNTVFGALGIGGLPYNAHGKQYIKSFIAIGAFCIGTIFFNILHRSPTGFHNQPTSRRRIIFVFSFLIQSLFIVISAALVTSGVVSNRPFVLGQFSSGSHTTPYQELNPDYANWRDTIPIVLLAFEAAGQVCLSRNLSVIELPTIVLSTLYHDWTADLLCTRNLWRQSSGLKEFIFKTGRRQNKRLASIISLFLGAFIGGEMYKAKIGMAGGLWLAAALKGGISFAFILWPKQKQTTEEK